MERMSYATFAALDGTVLTAGTPVVVYGFNATANATDNGSLIQLVNGSSGAGTIIITEELPEVDATLHTNSVTREFGSGIVFPAGCFVSLGSIATATIFYEKL